MPEGKSEGDKDEADIEESGVHPPASPDETSVSVHNVKEPLQWSWYFFDLGILSLWPEHDIWGDDLEAFTLHVSKLNKAGTVTFINLIRFLPQKIVNCLVIEEHEKWPPSGIDDKVDGEADVEDVVDNGAEDDPYGEGVVWEEEQIEESEQQEHDWGAAFQEAAHCSTITTSRSMTQTVEEQLSKRLLNYCRLSPSR